MSRCIYCRCELNNKVPADPMTASLEHILPLALGGSNQFVTMDASTKYNSEFGSEIDAPFMNYPLLAIKRNLLGLKGHSGMIPPIEWKIRSMENNEPGVLTIDSQGSVDVRFEPVVITDRKEKYAERLVAGLPGQVREILAGMLKSVQKKHGSVYTLSGEQIGAADDFERHYVIEDTGLLHAEIRPNYEEWVRGIFKIVLGLGHVVLGPNWTFGVDGGDRIRSVLVTGREHWPRSSMQGFTIGRIPARIAGVLGIDETVRAQNQHTLAILPGKTSRAVISLFGGDNVPEALISLGTEQGLLASPNETMNPSTRVGLRIDPVTRDVVWLTVADLNVAAEHEPMQ